MHEVSSGQVRLSKMVAYEYEKPLVVLIIISTCGCRAQVIRTSTLEVSNYYHNNTSLLQKVMASSFYLLALKRLFE
jgi:hypothetical protein